MKSDIIAVPEDIDAWYTSTFLKSSFPARLLLRSYANPLKAPKIFRVLQPQPEYRYTAFDAWRRAMWRPGGLPRQAREAIAVAVAVANQCVY